MECFKNCKYLDITHFNNVRTIGARCCEDSGSLSPVYEDRSIYITDRTTTIGLNAFRRYKIDKFDTIITPYPIDVAESKWPIATIIDNTSNVVYAHLNSDSI